MPWVTSGWNQLYKLFKRPSLVFTGICEASKLLRCLALFLLMYFTADFLFSNFSVLTARVEMWGILKCYCQTSIAPPPFLPLMTNVFPVQKHMLLLKKLCYNSWVLLLCLRLLGGKGEVENYSLRSLRESLTPSLCVLALKEESALPLLCCDMVLSVKVEGGQRPEERA